METLVSMSEAGLRYVLNNPRGYKLDDSRLSTRHLGALASALIYTPNRVETADRKAQAGPERQDEKLHCRNHACSEP
jgi:hypothetical protein